jgi:hypothetical protein
VRTWTNTHIYKTSKSTHQRRPAYSLLHCLMCPVLCAAGHMPTAMGTGGYRQKPEVRDVLPMGVLYLSEHPSETSWAPK